MTRTQKITGIILLVVFFDQLLKVWVKTHMYYGQEISLLGLDWLRLYFVENPGMAFGLSLGGSWGKLALSLFRLASILLLWLYLRYLLQNKSPWGLVVHIGLILAGALGNIIDSALYGLIFTYSDPHSGQIAELVWPGQGYAGFLHGRVVDMLYAPVSQGVFPPWFPIWGGEPYLFFQPVFNLADMSISIGVISVLLFQHKFFGRQHGSAEPMEMATPVAPVVDSSANLPVPTPSEND